MLDQLGQGGFVHRTRAADPRDVPSISRHQRLPQGVGKVSARSGRVPVDLADVVTKPSMPSGLAYRNTWPAPASAAGRVSGRSRSAAATSSPGPKSAAGFLLTALTRSPLASKVGDDMTAYVAACAEGNGHHDRDLLLVVWRGCAGAIK